MHNSKRAQISDTISWLVATIIIVLILSIPIILTSLGVLAGNKISFNRVQDSIATKSISGYLLQNYKEILTLETEKKEPSSQSKEKIEFLLRSLCLDNIEGWNILFFINEEKIYNRGFYKTATLGYDIYPVKIGFLGTTKKVFDNIFYFNKNNDKIVLEFFTQGDVVSYG